jgi:ABC-type antimicrobial peptide transport system permease subunit
VYPIVLSTHLACIAVFGGLILALVGIFGVTSYSVSRQIPEIGVRLALGAAPGRILRLVVVQGMKPVLPGVAVWLVAAVLLSRLVATRFFEVTPRDPLTYGVVVLLLVATAVVACMVPARQAMRVDVSTALRAE